MENFKEREARVVDYLDDKLQTMDDLDSLNALLSTLRNNHTLLQQQLEEAGRDHEEAKSASNRHGAAQKERAAQFIKEQADIDNRLMIITRSDTSDEAVGRFEASLEKLARLDVANAYVELLQDVDTLNKEAQSQLQTSSEAALGPYKQLQSLVTRLVPLHEAAEGATPHLLDHVVKTSQSLRKQIKDAFAADMEAILKEIKWPTPKAVIPATLQSRWDACIAKLLDLQMPELEALESSPVGKSGVKTPIVLFPLEVLVDPLQARFRYHFGGNRPTNRLDKPEWFLADITKILNEYDDFMVNYVQPVLSARFRGTDMAMNLVYIHARSAFVTALLPMVRSKIFATLPKVSNDPQLFSHLMHEIMSFDTTIRDDWQYDGGNGIDGWKGLAWEVLDQSNWFGLWLGVEKTFALSRYHEIISAPDMGDLDYESVNSNATKPTKGAIRVNDLLETITDRYRSLTSFNHKIRFLIDIQISIFDLFHERLHSGLEAYLAMTSSLGRTVQGVTKEEQAKLHGVEGLERLCRINGSADYLQRAMRDWSEDIFFIELWDELRERAQRSTSPSHGLGADLSIADVAGKTSTTVTEGGADADNGALFDETAEAYRKLRIRSEGIIVDVLSSKVRETLRAYRGINPWATLSGSSTTILSPTAELDPLLDTLRTSFSFLSRALAPAPLRRIVRLVLGVADQVVSDAVVNRHTFSIHGGRQLQADLTAVIQVVETAVGSKGEGVAGIGLRLWAEGCKLLGLPVKGSVRAGGGDEWEAWDDEAEEGGGRGDTLGLWEVEKRLFADNQSARVVLEELGIEALQVPEARAVIRRRVEIAG
ncbi:RINT-1 family protein-like protein [Mytilinidion resinicola]|uniref:RINT-1 family protein-like protein n=1 Tax=Mytilinidion resinicola TaxID=574789 RepID=A0A6A6Z0K1_9PEZI|nr:RINT-1 family protein-like protein [Mytilinidion resinicola]KAF2814249.1 RINT-1 family protein-like protein [Mytilinidion resinicola]